MKDGAAKDNLKFSLIDLENIRRNRIENIGQIECGNLGIARGPIFSGCTTLNCQL